MPVSLDIPATTLTERLVASCEPNWEPAVSGEITRQFPDAVVETLSPGWVAAEIPREGLLDRPTRIVAFARQVLPQALDIRESSITKTAVAVAEEIGRKLDAHQGPWRWHVFSVTAEGHSGNVGPRRCALLQEAVLEQLKRRYRRLAKRAHSESRATFDPDEACVQFAPLTMDRGTLSVLTPSELASWRPAVSGWLGGDLEVPEDKAAPSRACMKLYEAELRWGRPIGKGETCVDLGSSPGGWAWVAARRGASVIAIDRSPLREDLMEHRRVSFVKGDAFKFEPTEPVDWLFSDVIAFPQRIFELLETWLTNGWCRRFCVTIKFRGRDDDQWLTNFREMLSERTESFDLRRLKVNKNEVTAYGEAKRGLRPA